jgi:hypothetical protein
MSTGVHDPVVRVKKLLGCLVALLLVGGCATRHVFHDIDQPGLERKFRLRETDWIAVRDILKTDERSRDHSMILAFYERDLIEVQAAQNPRDDSGPVFFFRKDNGRWQMLAEMSVWYEK